MSRLKLKLPPLLFALTLGCEGILAGADTLCSIPGGTLAFAPQLNLPGLPPPSLFPSFPLWSRSSSSAGTIGMVFACLIAFALSFPSLSFSMTIFCPGCTWPLMTAGSGGMMKGSLSFGGSRNSR